jgi:hypothetical protein
VVRALSLADFVPRRLAQKRPRPHRPSRSTSVPRRTTAPSPVRRRRPSPCVHHQLVFDGINLELGAPHRRNHVLETGEQHRCGKMHDLIWLLGVALGRLAGGEIREPWIIELKLHEPRDGQLIVVEIEAALERVRPMLEAVTRKMNKAGRLDPFGYPLYCRFSCDRLDCMSKVLRGGD